MSSCPSRTFAKSTSVRESSKPTLSRRALICVTLRPLGALIALEETTTRASFTPFLSGVNATVNVFFSPGSTRIGSGSDVTENSAASDPSTPMLKICIDA